MLSRVFITNLSPTAKEASKGYARKTDDKQARINMLTLGMQISQFGHKSKILLAFELLIYFLNSFYFKVKYYVMQLSMQQ